MKNLLALIFTLISLSSLSQYSVIIGRDTIKTDDAKKIWLIIDSINHTNFVKYERERKRIQDSLEVVARLELRRAPTLYFVDTIHDDKGKVQYYTDYEKKPSQETLDKYKYDSLKTFSYLNYYVLKEINKLREEKIDFDSLSQSEFVEDNIFETVYNTKRGLLVKDEFEDCGCYECYNEIIECISSNKKLWKRILSNKTKYIYIAIYRDQKHLYIVVKRCKKFFFAQRTLIFDI